MCSLGMTFGKTETAHGGCLGVCGRGRTRADGDTRRGAVTTHRSCGFLMGQPASLRARHCQTAEGTGPTETSHVARGTDIIPLVAASEPGFAQTSDVPSRQALRHWGCRTSRWGCRLISSLSQLPKRLGTPHHRP
jgi:hypothetical protein